MSNKYSIVAKFQFTPKELVHVISRPRSYESASMYRLFNLDSTWKWVVQLMRNVRLREAQIPSSLLTL